MAELVTVPLAGRAVARVGYGAMQLTHGRKTPPVGAVSLLRAAVGSGANHVDTAWFYGAGACNALIREALAPYPENLLVATKVGAGVAPGGGLVAAQRPRELRRQVEDNVTSLGVDCLGLVYLRRLDFPPGLLAEGDQLVDLDDQLAELASLRDAGLIRAIGLSNVDVAQLRQAVPVGVEALQNAYNLLDRATEPVLQLCRELAIAWVPYIPLGSSFAGYRKVTEDDTVRAIAAELDVTAAQVGLAWLLAGYERTLLIPGTTSLQHLEANSRAANIVLGPDQLARLDAVR